MFLKVLVLLFISLLCFSVTKCNHHILKSETIIHLKLFNNCLTLYDNKIAVNETRYKFSFFNLDHLKPNDENIDIFVLNDKQNHFVRQQLFGHLYDPKEFVIISINVTNIEKHPFIIEFFERGVEDWKSFAFSYLLPFDKTETDGQLTATVIDKNKNLIGRIKIDYLIIGGITAFSAHSDHMIDVKSGAMIGHRGTGVGRRTDLKENILENTAQAFNYACLHNADMIELDIQLSKDNIPIIYHDFNAKLLSRELSTVENKDFDYEDNQPFETLKAILQKVEPKCGINFEIKYPQQYIDGKWNGIKGLELNQYIDIIVKTMYENIGNRSGIITSFHPDLCAMTHLKQNKFRVALLTSGDVVHWNPKAKPYLDPRATTIPLNTYFAQGMGLDGLSIYAKDILANTSLIDFVKSRNQSVYIWGDQLNNTKVLKSLIDQGVDGLIFDKIDKLLTQSVPEHSEQNFTNKPKVSAIIFISFVINFIIYYKF